MVYVKNAQNPAFPVYQERELDPNSTQVRWLPRRVVGNNGTFSCMVRITIYNSAANIPGVQTAFNRATVSWNANSNGQVAASIVASGNNNVGVYSDRATPPAHWNTPHMVAFVSLFGAHGRWVHDEDATLPGRHYIVIADIEVFRNNFVNWSHIVDMQRDIITHEIGHVIGLGHLPCCNFIPTRCDQHRIYPRSIMHNSMELAIQPEAYDRTSLSLFYGN
jgi:hypothetical protein